MKRIAVLVCAGLLLAGCETERSAYREYPPGRPYAVSGAPAQVAPAQAAAPVKIASSGSGTIASAQAGNYMDGQETELRQHLRVSGINVRRQGDAIAIDIGNDILFDTGSTNLSPRAQEIVSALASVLARYNKTLVEIAGYTDTAGAADVNLKLSQQRAQAVAAMLVDRGVDRSRVSAQGYGETHLRIVTGDNVNEPRNRRVEIRIVPRVAG